MSRSAKVAVAAADDSPGAALDTLVKSRQCLPQGRCRRGAENTILASGPSCAESIVALGKNSHD